MPGIDEILNKLFSPDGTQEPSGTDLVNGAIKSALPQSTATQTVNPYQLDIQRGLLGLKQVYDAAQKVNDTQGMQQAHTGAELLRNKANAAGIDVSGFDSGVSLADATNNLASQEARDIMNALQGQYSKSSEQYFSQKYDELLREGYSPRQAKKFAGDMARKYQANRVAYLNGLYNGYGRDGLVTNEYGNQFLGMLANENPVLANFYATIYPNVKDAYNRQNQLDDLLLAQKFGRENRQDAFNYNAALAQLQGDIARENYAANKNIDQKYWEAQEKIKQEHKEIKPTKVETAFQEGLQWAQMHGLEGDEALKVAADYADWALLDGGKNSKGNQSKEPKLTESQQKAFNQSENLFNNAFNSNSDDDIAAFEEFINEHGKEFDAGYYQTLKDMLLALKGFQFKLHNDDDNAAALWSKVSDVNVLEEMYPKENWDEYWKLKGGKPK